MTSRYVARKLTRHYYAELDGFLKSFDESRIESYETAIADALSEAKQALWRDGTIKKPTWQNGDYFFAAVVDPESGIVESKGIVIGAFLNYAPSGMSGVDLPRETAVVSHVAINEELLSANSGLLKDFFRLLQRAASARSKRRLYASAALDSALLNFLARNGFRMVSHEFRRNASTLGVKFQTDLVPTYTGDSNRWLSLCRWYLDLSFGRFVEPSVTDPSDKDQTTQQIEFDITPACRPGMVHTPEHLTPLKEHLYKVPLNAIVVPTPDFLTDENLVDEIQKHHRRDRHNIAFVDQRHGGGDPERKLDLACEIVYRNRLEEALKDVKGLYFDSRSTPRQKEWWDRWLRLKLGFEPLDRSGMIVEIDRESYEALLRKLAGKPERLLFLNDGGFGETARAGCSVFFYVWDAFSAASESWQVPGVIVACGRLAEAKAWSFKQLTSNWDDLSKYTIWTEFFVDQYFNDRVVGFFIDEIECITGVANGSSFPGVSYDGILRYVFQRLQTDKIAPEALQFQEELLPSWDIKNTYLDKDLSTAINEELRNRARTYLQPLLIKPKPSQTGLVEVMRASESWLTAAHWVALQPKRSEEPPPDVFLSFSGVDEGAGGWKTQVMRSFRGSLEGAHYRAPYAFDEGTKREALGKDWAGALVERMRYARTAVVLWSPDYLASTTCRQLELPYLLWRKHHHDLPIFWLRLMSTAQTKFKWEGVDLGAEEFDFERVNDDRAAMAGTTGLPNEIKHATLQALRDLQRLDVLNERLQGTVREIIAHLRNLDEKQPCT